MVLMKSRRKKQPRSPRPRLQRDLQWGVGWGLWFACFYSVLAVGIYLLSGGRSFDRQGLSLGATVGLYFGGGLTTGAIVGLLRPWTRRRVGAMLVGSVAVIPLVLGGFILLFGPIASWERGLWLGALMAAIGFGVVGALAWWE